MVEEAKNPHAIALSALGASKGGIARAEKLSSEQRAEIAKKGAAARWRGKPVRASHAAIVKVGDHDLPCANLPDGRRVVAERPMMRALGRGYSGYYSERDARQGGAADQLPRYLAPKVLWPYFQEDPESLKLLQPIAYVPPDGKGQPLKGINAEALPLVCEVWLKARADRKLDEAQLRTAAKAEILLRGLARIGIIALIDEATGYQYDRAKVALAEILERFISKDLARWAKTFDDDYYREIFRLRGWDAADIKRRPGVVGKWTTDIVYSRLAPGVLERLREVTPRDEKGRLKYRLFQRLTPDTGVPALREHLASVTTIMKLATNWMWFMDRLNRLHPKYNETLLLPFTESKPAALAEPG